jgi:hypothetical protein
MYWMPSSAKMLDRDDVEMVQQRRCLRLMDEASPLLIVCSRGGRQQPDGDEPVEPRIPGFVDLAHAPGSELSMS